MIHCLMTLITHIFESMDDDLFYNLLIHKRYVSKKLLNGRKTILTSEGSLVKNLERILERINQNRKKNILSNYLSSV